MLRQRDCAASVKNSSQGRSKSGAAGCKTTSSLTRSTDAARVSQAISDPCGQKAPLKHGYVDGITVEGRDKPIDIIVVYRGSKYKALLK
jgi:hypothetical protein